MFRSKLVVKYIGKDEKGVKWYELKKSLIFENTIIYQGFKTDMASVPKQLQWLYTPTGKYSRAAVVHDYLYSMVSCPKKVADDTFYRAMKCDGVDIITRHVFYWAVKYFGYEAYNDKH